MHFGYNMVTMERVLTSGNNRTAKSVFFNTLLKIAATFKINNLALIHFINKHH